jgi:hypothetical protein
MERHRPGRQAFERPQAHAPFIHFVCSRSAAHILLAPPHELGLTPNLRVSVDDGANNSGPLWRAILSSAAVFRFADRLDDLSANSPFERDFILDEAAIALFLALLLVEGSGLWSSRRIKPLRADCATILLCHYRRKLEGSFGAEAGLWDFDLRRRARSTELERYPNGLNRRDSRIG